MSKGLVAEGGRKVLPIEWKVKLKIGSKKWIVC